jgi:hypothetical protein
MIDLYRRLKVPFVVYILAAYIDFNDMKLFFRKMTPD